MNALKKSMTSKQDELALSITKLEADLDTNKVVRVVSKEDLLTHLLEVKEGEAYVRMGHMVTRNSLVQLGVERKNGLSFLASLCPIWPTKPQTDAEQKSGKAPAPWSKGSKAVTDGLESIPGLRAVFGAINAFNKWVSVNCIKDSYELRPQEERTANNKKGQKPTILPTQEPKDASGSVKVEPPTDEQLARLGELEITAAFLNMVKSSELLSDNDLIIAGAEKLAESILVHLTAKEEDTEKVANE